MTLFVLFLIYSVGLIVVGVPLGLGSLAVLRDPKHHRLLAPVLFPFTDENDIGRYDWEDPEYHNGAPYPSEALLVSWEELRRGFEQHDSTPIVRYVTLTALCWPLRSTWIVTVLALEVIGLFLSRSWALISAVIDRFVSLIAYLHRLTERDRA